MDVEPKHFTRDHVKNRSRAFKAVRACLANRRRVSIDQLWEAVRRRTRISYAGAFISQLASDLGWQRVEEDGRVYFERPHALTMQAYLEQMGRKV